MINLFLDDCRDAPSNNFVIVRNAKDALYILRQCRVNILSLDHDLGDNQSTGYDLLKILIESWIYKNATVYPFPKEIYLHSANPVGRENMYKLLMRYKPDYIKVYNCPIVCD